MLVINGVRLRWLAGKDPSCERWGMAAITGFHHASIRSADFDASRDFYTKALGLQPKVTWGVAPERAVMLHAGDARYVEIFERGETFEPGESTILHFALRTDDCAEMVEIVRAAGMEVTMETTDVEIQSPEGAVPVRIAFFKGPDGELVELFQNEVL